MHGLTAGRCSANATAKLLLRARFFSLKTRAGCVGFVARTYQFPDSVRLALPRSPESGFAVSADAKYLSREKSKMWMAFSVLCLYLVVPFLPHQTRVFKFFLPVPRAKLFASNLLCNIPSHARYFCSLFSPPFPFPQPLKIILLPPSLPSLSAKNSSFPAS